MKRMGCEEALQHLLPYLDQALGAAKHREVERHLEACRSCFSRAEFERRLKALLREVGRRPARAAFGKRIRTLLTRF